MGIPRGQRKGSKGVQWKDRGGGGGRMQEDTGGSNQEPVRRFSG